MSIVGPWEERIGWRENGCRTDNGNIAVVIDGCHFVIAPDYPAVFSGLIGLVGRRFDILMNGTKFIVTRNLWSQGKVPAEYRDRLPDNAIFVSENNDFCEAERTSWTSVIRTGTSWSTGV